MNTLSLVLRKDLRLLRLPVAGWLLLLVLQLAFAVSGLDLPSGPNGDTTVWSTVSTTMTLLHVALLVVLAAGIAQTDRPGSATAFWVTRPLGRWPLLGAKLVFLALVVLLPWLAANAIVLAVHGFTGADVLAALPWTFQVALVLALAVFAVGSLTSQLPRAIVALIGVVALLGGASWAMILLRGMLHAERTLGRGRAADAAAALVTFALAAMVIHSAWRRRTRPATAMVVAGAPIVMAVMHLWPWSLEPKPQPLPGSVQLAVADVARTGTAYVRPSPNRWVEWGLVGAAQASGLPAGTVAHATHVRSTVRWSSGRVEAAEFDESFTDRSRPAEGTAVEIEGLGTVSSLTRRPAAWTAVVSPTAWQEEQAAGGTASASARVELQLVREQLVARLALRSGERWSSGSERVTLLRVSLEDPPRLAVHATGPLGTMLGQEDRPLFGVARSQYYAFFNPGRRELIGARLAGFGPRSIPPVAGGLQVQDFELELGWPDTERWRARAQRAAWLRDAELVKIEKLVVAEGERTLDLPQLQLTTPPPVWR